MPLLYSYLTFKIKSNNLADEQSSTKLCLALTLQNSYTLSLLPITVQKVVKMHPSVLQLWPTNTSRRNPMPLPNFDGLQCIILKLLTEKEDYNYQSWVRSYNSNHTIAAGAVRSELTRIEYMNDISCVYNINLVISYVSQLSRFTEILGFRIFSSVPP